MTARTLTCQVIEVEDLTPDVFRVVLEGRAEAMAHAPGQYLEMRLSDDCWVPFSIASRHRDDGRLELHIQHWPERSNSAQLRAMLVVAEHLTVRLPSGDCVLDESSVRPLTLIAAGTGFAQMKAIVEAARHQHPERPITLWWAAKERRDLYAEELARQWVSECNNLVFHAVCEAGFEEGFDGERVYAHHGRIDAALGDHLEDVSQDDVYLSGSPGMVYACVDVLASLGLEPSRVFSDVFAYAPRDPLVPVVGSLIKEEAP
ncbi:FAD-binding oxidoreductase [Halomonas cupida]|uniref:FAD-binding oxidoreductase n=1 Tax=Halomonas TaxID=2745 RepID=UPI001A8FAA55|nr:MULTISPECIES: FAD-binding oxidoreductase [Halomonas]MBN8411815.1 NAD(P)H-flavin reductase [Halomonas litopenaei]MBY6028864.1 NAD(P)H-flavin reductase [Halomonas sp. DP8Y7-1]MED5297359.1 FAD-binding oxidoreductase [Pseudomonadota bacterium]MEE3214191.1 FAD-binding oxidoreductase [Pseudomonadota bacterium]